MKKLLTFTLTIVIALSLTLASGPVIAAETPNEGKKADAPKKAKKASSKKKKASKKISEAKPAAAETLKPLIEGRDEAKQAPAAPETLKPLIEGQPEAAANQPAVKPAVSNASDASDMRSENVRSGLSGVPVSSDISNLMFASSDMTYLLPQDLSSRWGFVFAYNYYKFIDEDKNSAVADTPTGADAPDLRFWISKRLKNNDNYYMRARYGRLNLKGDNNLAAPNSKNIGLKFDMLYYTFNRKPDTSVRVGRQFLRVGRGFTYAGISDGLHIEKLYPKWVLAGFGARTQPRETNNDQSNAGYLNRSYRDFYGVQADYLGLKNKKVYGYILAERDGKVKIPYVAKEFTYDANYYGAGLEGSFKPNWPYYFEYVVQNGKTASTNAATGTDNIKANAYYLGTDYYFQNNKYKPFLTLEYAHASGDPDRASVTNVIGGNLAGTDDKNFMPYGVYDLGLALHPRLSNINVFKFGGFIKPFYKSEYFKEMQLGAKYMIYNKADANGAVSDAFATVANKKLGTGYDLYLTWRLFSDTLIYVNYGVFSPGDAYPAGRRDSSKLINFGTTLFF